MFWQRKSLQYSTGIFNIGNILNTFCTVVSEVSSFTGNPVWISMSRWARAISSYRPDSFTSKYCLVYKWLSIYRVAWRIHNGNFYRLGLIKNALMHLFMFKSLKIKYLQLCFSTSWLVHLYCRNNGRIGIVPLLIGHAFRHLKVKQQFL